MSAPDETILFSRPADLPDVEVISVSNSLRLWKVFHTTYNVCTGLACEQPFDWSYRHQYHTTPQHRLMVLEPGETHENRRMRSPCTYKVVLIAPALLETLAAEAGLRGPPHFNVAEVAAPDLFQAFVAFHAALALRKDRARTPAPIDRDALPHEKHLVRLHRFASHNAAVRRRLSRCGSRPGCGIPAGSRRVSERTDGCRCRTGD
jgi:hypothetical protein